MTFIQTRPCKENEQMSYDFTGKGKIIDGKLEGPGKLIIKKTDKYQTQICADRIKYNGKVAKKFVGTFKNGTMHGPGMTVLEDDSTLITNFEKGIPKGLLRYFT